MCIRDRDMGITKGSEIFIRKVAPLGDPVEITVRGYELSVRKNDAQCVFCLLYTSFTFGLNASSYGSEGFTSDIQLADSGYGQGKHAGFLLCAVIRF